MSTTESPPWDTAPHRVGPICDELQVSDDVRERAIELAREYDLNQGVAFAPSSIAAGAVYLAGLEKNEKIIQQDIADVSDASVASLRDAYTEMAEAEDGVSLSKTTTDGSGVNDERELYVSRDPKVWGAFVVRLLLAVGLVWYIWPVSGLSEILIAYTAIVIVVVPVIARAVMGVFRGWANNE